MEWNNEVIARLRALWDEGLSTADIGRRLGVTKNAVVGKAHRLDLPARPSPIRRGGGGSPRPRAPRRISGPTLPPLSCTRAPAPTPASEPRQERPLAVERLEARPLAVVRAVPPPSSAAPRPYARVVPCCWPIGEPGTKGFRFCDEGSAPGKPYCAEHAQLAYVRVKDRREDAA
jgi:GcrA cell cycle regulator